MHVGILALTVLGGLSTGATFQDAWRFVLVPEESRFTVDVGTAGFFKFFGHDHRIEVQRFTGNVDWNPDAPERTEIRVEVEAGSLQVIDEDDEEERAQIQADMETKVLALEDHPAIRFVSTEVSLERQDEGGMKGKVRGELTLRDVTREIEIPVTLTVTAERLQASGEFELKGSRYGVEQVSAAGGTVKTKDELELQFDLVGLREP